MTQKSNTEMVRVQEQYTSTHHGVPGGHRVVHVSNRPRSVHGETQVGMNAFWTCWHLDSSQTSLLNISILFIVQETKPKYRFKRDLLNSNFLSNKYKYLN